MVAIDPDSESLFRSAMTELAESVVNRANRRTYDIVIGDATRFIDEFLDCSHGGDAYCLWMEVSDLYDDPRGPMSEQLCDEIGHRAASEWLAIAQSSQDAIDAYFRRWKTPEPWRGTA